METFVWIVCAIVVICNIGILIWIVLRNHKSDEAYERAIDEIYGRKR